MNEDKPPMTFRGKLLTCAALVTGVVAVNAVATQYVAWQLGYHPVLGQPWFSHVYAPWSWLQWVSKPWVTQAKNTFAAAGTIVLAGSLLGIGTGALLTGRGRRSPVKNEGVHGTARWMNQKEMEQTGLLARKGYKHGGIYVGGWRDDRGQLHYLRHDGPEHAIVIAPTRSGKGIGNILPTLLSWPGSTLVYDEKGELWQLTAGCRSEMGQTPIRLELGALEGSAGFNFLEEIRLGTPYEVADAQSISLAICDPNGDGIEGKDHWGRTSFDLLAAVMLHELYAKRAEGRVANLTDVAYAISDPDSPSDALWEEMRGNGHMTGKYCKVEYALSEIDRERYGKHGPDVLVTGARHRFIASCGQDMADRSEKERKSVLSSAKTYLTLARDPLVERNIRESDFRLNEVMNHQNPVSIYLICRGAEKERLKPLYRLFLTMLIRHLTGVELTYRDGQALMPHKHRLLMMLDEFPSLGRMAIIEDSITKCAAYGIKMFLAAQTREQIFRAYTNYQWITGNCHIKIIYAPNEKETADWVSDMLGTTTIITQAVTESGTKFGTMRNVSRTYHEVKRPLLTSDEIRSMKPARKTEHIGPGGEKQELITEPGDMAIIMGSEHPVQGTQILYFNDAFFAGKARIAPPRSGSTRRQVTRFRVIV